MSWLTLIMLVTIIGVILLVLRSIVRVYRRAIRSPQPITKFPTFSIITLSISLVLLVVGTLISLQISDALGGAIASLGGFFGLFESNVRHKREALQNKTTEEESASE